MRLFLAIAAIASSASPVLAAEPVMGKWVTASKDSVVEIGTCGGTVCGKVLRVLRNMPNGKPPVDLNNPNPALRSRAVAGIMILTGFVESGNSWKGKIYDPRSGKTYTSYLTRNADGTLKVQGCVGPFCQAYTWTAAR
jgi:uncharacterized protein (DUF2147 family)